MNLKEIKFHQLEKLAQVVLFDSFGKILDSDEALIPVKDKAFNIFDDTMLSGTEDLIEALRLDEEITYDSVNMDLFGKNSCYDFIFKKVEEKPAKFAMIFLDFGVQYNKIFELQQERNLAEIHSQKAQREVGKVREEKDALHGLYQELLKGQSSQYILVKADNLLINLELKDINYLEAFGDYIKVHTSNKTYVTYNTMKNLEAALPNSQFFRMHRSYIIRLDKVVNIEQLSVLINDTALPIGKNYKSSLIERMGQL